MIYRALITGGMGTTVSLTSLHASNVPVKVSVHAIGRSTCRTYIWHILEIANSCLLFDGSRTAPRTLRHVPWIGVIKQILPAE